MMSYWLTETTLIGDDARTKLMRGVEKVECAVRGTLGPGARTVVIEREEGFPLVYNDGVYIAKAVNDPDPYVQMGIDLIRQVAEQAQSKSGDGTTTATVLAKAICDAGFDAIENGYDPVQLKKDLEYYLTEICWHLRKEARDATEAELWSVATIASNNDEELGTLISKVLSEIGEHGAVAIEAGTGPETTYEIEGGLEVHAGAISPHFPTQMKDALCLLVAGKIKSFDSLLPALQLCVDEERPLVIIADDFNPQVLPDLLLNVVQGKVNATILKTPGMGDVQRQWMEDIHAVVGGSIFSPLKPPHSIEDDMDLGHLGRIASIEIKKDHSVIVDGNEKPNLLVEKRLEDLFMAMSKAEHDWDKKTFERRIARLQSGVATIKVGGFTDLEILETRERIDDAVNATKAAMKNGIVTGGGLALWDATIKVRNDIHKSNEGFDFPIMPILAQMETPSRLIAENMGMNSLEFATQTEDGDVYDPLDVVINSLKSAVSIAKLVLLSDALVALPR